jgi:hypothetical protein
MQNDRLKFKNCRYYSDPKRGKDSFALLFVILAFAF